MLFPMGSGSRITKDEEVQFPARAYEGGESGKGHPTFFK